MGGVSCLHLIEGLSAICRDASARLPFEIIFSWSLFSTFMLSLTSKQKLQIPQKNKRIRY